MHCGTQGAALDEEIAARDAAISRAAEMRVELEKRQSALADAEKLHRRRIADLEALKQTMNNFDVRHWRLLRPPAVNNSHLIGPL